MTTEVVTLKNGSQEARVAVAAIMLNLRKLLEQDPIGFYEFVSACRNPGHQIWGDYAAKLTACGLMESGSRIHQTVRAVTLSAVTGDDFEMQLGSPLAEAAS